MIYTRKVICRCGEMADAQDSKSCDGNIMSVRPRPPAPPKIFYFIQSKQFIKTIVNVFVFLLTTPA